MGESLDQREVGKKEVGAGQGNRVPKEVLCLRRGRLGSQKRLSFKELREVESGNTF